MLQHTIRSDLGIGVLAGLALLTGCNAPPPTAPASTPPPSVGFAEERAALEAGLARLSARLEATQDSRDAAPARALFEGWLRHARLTGQPQSLQQADAALAALRQRSAPLYPCRESAQLALSTHRPAAAEVALERCPSGAGVDDLRADIAFYQGQYQQALDFATAALNAAGPADVTALARMARLRQSLGSPVEAGALLQVAEARYRNANAYEQAWLRLQRGILDLQNGAWESARAHFLRTTELFPDWWLAEEHLAEVEFLLGNAQRAADLYDKVIAATGYPEFLAARADVALSLDDPERAQNLLSQARQIFADRLQQFPDAYGGHAVGFALDHADPATALALAEQDYARRPYGEAAMALATAHLQAGAAATAAEVLQPHLQRGWSTHETDLLLSEIRAALAQR